MKKSLTFILGLAFLTWVVFQIDFKKIYINSPVVKESCPFCNSDVIERQSVYRESGCIALLSYKPAVRGHMLIIPERHVERFEDLTSEEIAKIHAMIAKVDVAEKVIYGSTGYVLLQKNGAEAGQTVPHVHFHYLRMTQGDSKIWFVLRAFVSPWLKALTPEEINNEKSKFQRNRFVD